jgi:uncharacterized membrane protein
MTATTPSSRFRRWLRHRWFDDTDAQRAFGADGLAEIERLVAGSERRHSGEIRICVEAGLPLSYLWRRATVRERAVSLFGKLRVWDTEHNNGVLIYLLLAEQAIEIVADRGLAKLVTPAQWQAILDSLATDLRAGRHRQGLTSAVQAVGRLLEERFPLDPSACNPDELPNRVDLR